MSRTNRSSRYSAKMAQYLLAAVGNTPLVELDFFAEIPEGVRLFAKLESTNPGGSIKDRSVARMLSRALDQNRFAGGKRLIDSTSGNAGIAYAMFGAVLGIDMTLVIPASISRERLHRIEAHGAEAILTDPLGGQDAALREARRLVAERPDLYWYCDQFANEANWRTHYETTGREILTHLMVRAGAAPSAFVAGVGTGGTITGVGKLLKEANPDARVVAAVPDALDEIDGLKPFEGPDAIVPEILDESLIDATTTVTADDARTTCRRLAEAGLFVGPSSGASVNAALELCATGEHDVIVTILADSGDRYASAELLSTEEARAG